MYAALFALAASGPVGLYLARSEVVVDCSGRAGVSDARLAGVVTARDGSAVRVTGGEFFKGSYGSAPRSLIRATLDFSGWRFRYEDGFKVVVTGSKSSPVKSARFAGDVWVPAVARRPAGPGWVNDK